MALTLNLTCMLTRPDLVYFLISTWKFEIIEKYLIYVDYLIGAIKGHKINYLIIRSKRYLYQYWMSFFLICEFILYKTRACY